MLHFYDIYRKNKISQWAQNDCANAYVSTQNDGRLNYRSDEFVYKYNSDGFRSDEFSIHSDFPILFTGCSLTEGIGLPIEHTWPYFFLQLMKDKNNKLQLPLHSVALGGTGVDTAAELITKFSPTVMPKLILGFFHSSYRRDYCTESKSVQHWTPTSAEKYLSSELTKLFSNKHFAAHQSYRSLQIIDLAAKLIGSKVILFFNLPEDDYIFSLPKFQTIDIVKLPPDNSQLVIPDEILSLPTDGRDNIHPGAVWQYNLATTIFSEISLRHHLS